MPTLPVQQMTLCLFRNETRILLAMKKRDFGKGKWNGYGGKVESGETIEQALVREVKEESTVELLEYEKRGELAFHYTDTIMQVHIYEAMRYNGAPEETEEMSPRWFDITELPFDTMWPDDKHWFPYFLKKISFTGNVTFDNNYRITNFDIKKSGA